MSAIMNLAALAIPLGPEVSSQITDGPHPVPSPQTLPAVDVAGATYLLITLLSGPHLQHSFGQGCCLEIICLSPGAPHSNFCLM